MTVDSPPLRCLLASCWTSSSAWSGMFSSLARLQASTGDMAALPAPSSGSFQQWCEHILAHHGDWRNIVKKYRAADLPRVASRGAEPPPAAADDPEVHPEIHASALPAPSLVVTADQSTSAAAAPSAFCCSFSGCTFKAKNAAGLAMHARRKRDIQTPLSLRLASHICPSCELPFDTRDRALDHLKTCKRCNKFVMDNVAPMTHAELRMVLDKEKGANYAWSRAVTPKPGPKPPGERPPRHAVAPLFISEEQQLAATLLD
eukprot:414973-Amphidinium_carterae.2